MKTTLEIPEELVEEVKRRAGQEGKMLEDAVADLLRKGLAAGTADTEFPIGAEEWRLQRRREVAEKFVSGEWGLALEGFEAGRAADRELARERTARWSS